jgi:hypothetical protein
MRLILSGFPHLPVCHFSKSTSAKRIDSQRFALSNSAAIIVKVHCSKMQYVIVGCNTLQDGPLTKEGSAVLDELRVMLSRAAKCRQACETGVIAEFW